MDADWQDKIRKNAGVDVSGDADPPRLWAPMQLQALVFGMGGTAKFLDLTPNYRGLLRNTRAAPLGRQLKRDIFNYTPPRSREFTCTGRCRPRSRTSAPPPRLMTAPPQSCHWSPTDGWSSDYGRRTPSCITNPGSSTAISGIPKQACHHGWTGKEEPTRSPSWDVRDRSRTGIARSRRRRRSPLSPRAILPSPRFIHRAEAFSAFTTSPPTSWKKPFIVTSSPAGFPTGRPIRSTYASRGRRRTRRSRLKEKLTGQEEARLKEKLTGKERWLRRMGQLQWAIPGDFSVLPTALTCYGVISPIEWKTAQPCESFVRPTVTAALGANVIEAAAALATRTDVISQRLLSELQYATLAERRPSYEDIVAAAQTGKDEQKLADKAKSEGFFKILSQMLGARARLHDRSFSPRDGGLFWEIVQQEEGAKVEDANAQPLPRLTENVASKLCELNRAQRKYDESARTLAGWQRRLFAVWCQNQYRNSIEAKPPATDEQKRRLLEEITTCKGKVDSLTDPKTGIVAKETALKTATDELKTALGREMPKASFVARAMPRFSRANDPFVLIEGLPAPAMQGGAPLQCRVSNGAIAGIELQELRRSVKSDQPERCEGRAELGQAMEGERPGGRQRRHSAGYRRAAVRYPVRRSGSRGVPGARVVAKKRFLGR